MPDRKMVIRYLLLTALAAVFTAIPSIQENTFIFAVILGGLPVYIAARLNYILGFGIYFSIAIFSAILFMSEALFFICITGSIGLTLGIMKDFFRHVYAVPIPSALVVYTMLSTVNYLLGINIFGNASRWELIRQAFALIPLLYVFCLIHLEIFMLVEKAILKSIKPRIY